MSPGSPRLACERPSASIHLDPNPSSAELPWAHPRPCPTRIPYLRGPGPASLTTSRFAFVVETLSTCRRRVPSHPHFLLRFLWICCFYDYTLCSFPITIMNIVNHKIMNHKIMRHKSRFGFKFGCTSTTTTTTRRPIYVLPTRSKLMHRQPKSSIKSPRVSRPD